MENAPLLQADVETETEALDRVLLGQLRQEGVWRDGRLPRVVVAYSGGPDSTALLHAASRLKTLEGADVVAVYYNHGWRGKPPQELGRLHQNCLQLRVPLFVVNPHPMERKTETSAREFRYRALAQVAHQVQADVIVTAHHSDDQVETLLFRLFRGTGLDGLTGIRRRRVLPVPGHPTSKMLVLRPFLGSTRQQVRDYITRHELESFKDPTNEHNHYVRNALRNEWLPGLEGQFPQIKDALLRLSTTVSGELNMLSVHLDNIWQELVVPEADVAALPIEQPRGPALRVQAFCQLGPSYQRRLMRRLLQAHGLGPDFQTVEMALAFVTGRKRVRRDKPLWSLGLSPVNGLRLFLLRLSDVLLVVDETQLVMPEQEKALASSALPVLVQLPSVTDDPFVVPWPFGGSLQVEPIEKLPQHLPDASATSVIVNLQPYRHQELVFRVRQPGDRLTPIGLDGTSVRLKKFLSSHKIPGPLRDRLPLLACQKEVLWVPGQALSQYLAFSYGERWKPSQAMFRFTWLPD